MNHHVKHLLSIWYKKKMQSGTDCTVSSRSLSTSATLLKLVSLVTRTETNNDKHGYDYNGEIFLVR